MIQISKLSLFVLVLFAPSVFADLAEQNCIQNQSDIIDKLKCLSHVKVFERLDEGNPLSPRVFDITIEQLVDHFDPSSEVFQQKLALIHRGEDEPMVLQTSGYSIFGVHDTGVTLLFETNQLQIEHRYFSASTPASLDWSKLNIKQSADDFHAITEKFKQIYTKSWVGTGQSKGGMTSVYHRYYYPDDLDGTIAFVAPLSFDTADLRYVDFLENVGGPAFNDCRENVKIIQRRLLENREQIVPSIAGSFTQLGNADVAFEHAVIESSFIFFQYGKFKWAYGGCDLLPINGSIKELSDFLTNINPVSDYSDNNLSEYMPYYYQAATELGCPESPISHLKGLQKYPFSIEQYIPKGVPHSYSNQRMKEVDQWVRKDADKIIFIYGEMDPWTAGAFPVSETGKDVSKYVAPGEDHSTGLWELKDIDYNQVTQKLSEFLKKKPAKIQAMGIKKPIFLEDLERQNSKRI